MSPRSPNDSPHARYVLLLLATAAVYFGSAKLGLTMAFVAEQVTPVWPPTGIALTVVLLLGYRIWPGIWLGAFLANATAHEPIATACGIASGNTLEAVTGAWLLHRYAGFGMFPDRLKDVLGLVTLAALLSTSVSATIGVASLSLGGVQPWSAFPRIWYVWWLGDAMGDLVMAPVLLAWARALRTGWHLRRFAEAGTSLGALILVSLTVFAGGFGGIASGHPLEYIVFPFVIYAALRFGQLGATTVTFVASAIAIWGTVHGRGPFASGNVHESLMLLQLFMAVVAVSGLHLAAVMDERNIAARRRAADYAASQALAGSGTLNEAAPRILRAICESLEWDLGALWTVDERANVLCCVDVWHPSSRQFFEFESITRQRTFSSGVGLPGRVWVSGKAAWIPDVVHDTNFPRAPVAAMEGLHGAFGFPVVLGDQVLGVLEFFSQEIQRPDADLLAMMTVIGHQIGQFIDRKRAETEREELLAREQAARAEAEAANRAKDEFLAMLGHELRNPLGAIMTAVAVLNSKPDDQTAKPREIIARQIEQLSRLVDDLLDVSRVASGRIELQRQPVDLRQVAEQCLLALEQAGRTTDRSLSLIADPSRVEGDPTRLEQIVGNLLDNALKCTPPGGRIDITVGPEGEQAVLRVQDSGIGIEPDLLPRVFDLFTQGRQPLARTKGGLGLGLTLVKRLVELHGGTVVAHSAGPGHGSQFVVRLPLLQGIVGEFQERSQRPLVHVAPRRVLVIEDRADARDSLRMLLELKGHQVEEAPDGVRGLERLLSSRPDVALIDVGLPGLDGYAVARAAREAPGGKGLFLVAITGYGQPEDRQRAVEAGFDTHLVKPIGHEELLEVLAACPQVRKRPEEAPS